MKTLTSINVSQSKKSSIAKFECTTIVSNLGEANFSRKNNLRFLGNYVYSRTAKNYIAEKSLLNFMRILVLSSRFPFPLEKGDKLRLYNQLKILSQRHEVHLLSIADENVQESHIHELEAFCKSINIVRISTLKAKLACLRGVFNGNPFQTEYFYSKRVEQQLVKLVTTLNPDVIFCQLARMAKYCLPYKNIPLCIDYMDAFAKGLERRSERTSGIESFATKVEANRLKNFEENIFSHFHSHAIISEQDKKFIGNSVHPELFVVPNGIDTHYYSRKANANNIGHSIMFAGNFGYAPNKEAANYLIDEVMPLVWKKIPQASLYLVGAEPSEQLIAKRSPRVKVTGWVDDIREFYNKCTIGVAPMFMSIGQQNKILQSMSMEQPTVVTTLANNAIGAIHQESTLLADSPEEFSRSIIELLQNKELRDKISHNAFNLVSEQFSWFGTTKLLEQVLETAILNFQKKE